MDIEKAYLSNDSDMTKYKHNKESEEEYIDLVPILRDLYIDVSKFLKPIKGVELAYGQA